LAKKKTSRILIGLFVVIGSAIGVIAVVWLGASKYFESGAPYAAYFDESVQGLSPDSSVKLRGVSIGRVETIGVVPGSAFVEVIMKLNMKDLPADRLCAELKSAGLTGIMFIDLDLIQKGEAVDSSPPGWDPPHPVIRSRPSRTKHILTGIDTLIEKVNQIHTGAITKNLESATARLDIVLRRTDRILADERIEQILTGTRDTIAEARTALNSVKSEIQGMRLKETSGQAHNILESLGKDSRKISTDLKITGENLRQVSENLETLVQRLQTDPSEILFSSRPPPRQRQEYKP